MGTTTTRWATRTATPERWAIALARALAEGVQVRQLAGSGQWIATSGRDAGTAYGLAVTGGVAHGCDCLAGLNGDPVCKHRAAYYAAAGLLDPEPPTPAAPALVTCWECRGTGDDWAGLDGEVPQVRVPCPACLGAGEVEEPSDEEEGEDGPGAAPYDARGLTPAQIVALKADALRHAVEHGAPLVDPFSGRVIDRHNCRDAA